MSADMGGTEIFSPLEKIFSNKMIKGQLRSVFVLTDGNVRNTYKVIGLVRNQCLTSGTRVFALGIGHGVSTSLIKGIANNGGGKAEFITEKVRMKAKVVSLLKCAMQPAITDITIDWALPNCVTPICIPTEPPTMISAGRLTFFAILQGVDRKTDYLPSSVSLTGRQGGKDVSYNLAFKLSKSEEINVSAPVHRLATKVQIKLLQAQESLMIEEGETTKEELRHKIIDLSRHGNIASKYAAFVAVDTDGKKIEGNTLQRPCPVPATSEKYAMTSHVVQLRYGIAPSQIKKDSSIRRSSMRSEKHCASLNSGLLGQLRRDNSSIRSTIVANCSYLDSFQTWRSKPVQKTSKWQSFLGLFTRKKKLFKQEADTRTETEQDADLIIDSADEKMMSVIALQQIHGEWEPARQLLDILGIKRDVITKQRFSEDPRVVCTVVVISWLRRHYPDKKDEWQMIERKAVTWLTSKNLPSSTDDIIMQVTQELWP